MASEAREPLLTADNMNEQPHAPTKLLGKQDVPSLTRHTSNRRQRLRNGRAHTAFLINLVSIMERMDEQVLPAVSSSLACAFQASLHQLGAITFWRATVQALSSPLGGIAGHHYNRVLVLTVGCTIWGCFTFAFAFSQTVDQGILIWAFNGIGLALMIPNAQSLIADFYPAHRRGGAFGMLQLTSALGGMLGAVFATNISGYSPLGIEGWRFAFLAVAIASLTIGFFTLIFGVDPRCPAGELRPPLNDDSDDDDEEEDEYPTSTASCTARLTQDDWQQQLTGTSPAVADTLGSAIAAPGAAGSVTLLADPRRTESSPPGELVAVLVGANSVSRGSLLVGSGSQQPRDSGALPVLQAARPLTMDSVTEMLTIPTFVIIILQGIVGSTPSTAMVFLTLYLQLIGMSNLAASMCMALLLAGNAFGGLIGGWIGDTVARRSPNRGRIAAVQFSVGVGVPLSVLLLKGLPMNGEHDTVAMYAGVLLVFGLLTSWAAPACNNPIFAEIVPADMRTLVYSFDRSFEGAIAAMGAPLVGLLAETYFGFPNAAAGKGCSAPLPSPMAPKLNLTAPMQSSFSSVLLAPLTATISGQEPDPSSGGGIDPGGDQPHTDLDKAISLGNALLVCMVIPWALCTLFYTGLYWTYPRDRDNARRRMREAALLRQASLLAASGVV